MTQETIINPNSAEMDELRSLPGIGPALAERIIAARPFNAPQDMLRVTGVSPSVLEKIQPFLQFDSPAEAEIETPAEEETDEIMISEAELESALADAAKESTGESTAETLEEETPEDEPEPELIEEESTAPPPPPVPAPARSGDKMPNFMTRSQVFWMTAAFSFFTFIIAVALTLSIVSALNGGLRFASPRDVNTLRSQISDLQTQSETLDGDLTDLRTRMDNFDAIGGRVTSLEDHVDTLSSDFETVSSEVETLTSDVAAVSETVDSLRTDSNRFQSFLEGLAELLLGLTPEGSNE